MFDRNDLICMMPRARVLIKLISIYCRQGPDDVKIHPSHCIYSDYTIDRHDVWANGVHNDIVGVRHDVVCCTSSLSPW